MTSYRQEHEAFTSNTSTKCHALHVLLCICHMPVFLAISNCCYHRWKMQPTLLKDFVMICVPMVLVLTVAADYAAWTMALLILVLYMLYKEINPTFINEPKTTGIIHPISQLKGINMLITCIAILAVDFKVFPRYFAKTETYGFSLMDIGIAMFIISSGLTSKYARGITDSNRSSYSYIAKRGVILLLGIGRLITLKSIDYQEHNTEYGIHWNFFVTIFSIWILTDVINTLFSRVAIAILCVFVLGIYQFALCTSPLSSYILHSDRNTFLDANREGVCSLPAGVVLYLLTEILSYFLYYCKDRSVFTSKFQASGVVAAVMWCMWYTIDAYIQPTSRRLMNAPYVCLSLAIAFTVLTILFAIDSTLPAHEEQHTSILQYFNKYQLQIFLFANVCTGLVNVSIPTIRVSLWCGLCIVIVYMWVLALGALAAAHLEGISWKSRKNDKKTIELSEH